MKRRYFVQLSFRGTRFHGWQKQPNAISVQDILNKVISTLLKEEINTVGAGRTDAGVHAGSFTAHFESNHKIDAGDKKRIASLNAMLPEDIVISDIYEVRTDAHARFSAIERTYHYTILTQKNPFLYEFGWYCKHQLNVDLMNQAAKILFKHNNFECFSKLHSDVKTHICIIKQAGWEVSRGKLVFGITADRFLRNMVRAIVGTMIDIGRGRTSLNDFEMIIESKNRNLAGASAPACGLILTDIKYPVDIKLT